MTSNEENNEHKHSVSIRWDCQNIPINNPYLARYLLIFAGQQGSLVDQKAYAYWRNENLAFEQRLYELGFDCIDVPITTKNGVDKKMIADIGCEIARNLSSDIFILVTGDGDFAQSVRQLKAKGKKVIIFAQSRKVNQRLIQLADEYYFVDQLPELRVGDIQPQTTSLQTHIGYNEAIDYLIAAIKTASSKGKRTVLGCIDKLMRQLFSDYQGVASIRTPDGKKFSKFSKFVAAVVAEGKIGVRNLGKLQELFLI